MDPVKKSVAKELAKESAKIMAKAVGKKVAGIMLAPVFDPFGFGSSSDTAELKQVLDKLNIVMDGQNKILNEIDLLAESVERVPQKTIIMNAELEIQHYVKTMLFICKIQNKEERAILIKHLSSAPYGGMKLFENIMNITSALSGTLFSTNDKGFLSAIIDYKFIEYFKKASRPGNNSGLFVLDIQTYFSNLMMLLAKGMQCLTAIRLSENLDETIAYEQETFRDSISELMDIFDKSLPENLRQIVYRMNEQKIEPEGVNPEYPGKSLKLDFPMLNKPPSSLVGWKNLNASDVNYSVQLVSDEAGIEIFKASSNKWFIEPINTKDDQFYLILNNLNHPQTSANEKYYLSLNNDGGFEVSKTDEPGKFRIVVDCDNRLGLAIIGDANAGLNYVGYDENKLYSRENKRIDSKIPSPFTVSEYVANNIPVFSDGIGTVDGNIGNPTIEGVGSLGEEPLLGDTPIISNKDDKNVKPPKVGPLGPSLGNIFNFKFF